ncbi:unnamed protein product, partial [Ectocarpus sp. 12 AP-2014]
SKFKISVHAAHQGGNDSYEEFIAIVDEYIKDNSNFEVNIDSRTKKEILGFGERSAYASLGTESRMEIFSLAEKEVAMMLADNLLLKFKASDEYKEIAGDLLFGAN